MRRAGWTYGAEYELSDWPRDRELPVGGWSLDERDVTMVNNNGIAVDPKGISYRFGGEFKAPPCGSPEQLAEQYGELLKFYPEATVNYRSNLHVHIRVPGLRDDLAMLKRIAFFNWAHLKELLESRVEPIPRPTTKDYPNQEEYDGAMRRYRRRRVSHHTVIPLQRVSHQLEATTVDQFHEFEVPWSHKLKAPQWQCQPRQAVNLRQLRETDTVEFRHFPGTLNPEELKVAADWCAAYLECAMVGGDPKELFDEWFHGRRFPTFPPYVHWMEKRYRATVLDGTVPRSTVEKNIKDILAGRFPE